MKTDVNNTPHPGEFIEEELKERGWSQRDLSYILGGDQQAVNRIISGKRGISPEMAKALAVAFDVHPEFFVNLQKAYELAVAKEPDPAVSFRARVQSVYPLRDMIKRGWIENSDDPEILEAEFCQFFNARTVGDVPQLAHAPKKTRYEETPPQQIAWLYRAKQMAEALPVKRYSEKKLRAMLSEFKEFLFDPDDARNVPQMLEEVGVRFVVIEPLPGSKIDGVCFWLDAYSPVIGMSLRFDRIDNFWFVLRHEIEHVLRKHGRGDAAIDSEMEDQAFQSDDLAEEERLANEAAANFLVPSEKMESFMVRMRPVYSNSRIVLFAKSLGIHPGFVVGQLQNRKEIPYSSYRKYLVKIRNTVVANALTDGWGNISTIYN